MEAHIPAGIVNLESNESHTRSRLSWIKERRNSTAVQRSASPADNNHDGSRNHTGNSSLGWGTLPDTRTNEGRVFPREKARVLKEEIKEEEGFKINLRIACPYDAQRMKMALDNIAIRLTQEELDLARTGLSASSLRCHMAQQKFSALRNLGPGPCQHCGDEGDDTNKMVRTGEGCGVPGDQQHWHHQSCLRRMFLLAIKDEEKLPPRCCGIPIPEGYTFDVLSRAEFRAYKYKREEKNTANRTYCPACSYFISPRVIEYAINARVKALKQLERKPKGYISGSVRCPRCTGSMCLLCKRIEHPGEDCPI